MFYAPKNLEIKIIHVNTQKNKSILHIIIATPLNYWNDFSSSPLDCQSFPFSSHPNRGH